MIPESQKKAIARYKEKHPDRVKDSIAKYQSAHPEKLQEARARYEEKRPPRDRREYQREYRLKRKLEGRPVPGGSVYKKKED